MNPRRPSNRDLALFAAPCLGLAGIGLPLTVYLPTFYSSELGLDLSAVGVAFMIVRLLDIGVDPVLGVLMDGTRTRFGRFKVWLAGGVPLLMLASALLFFARPGVSQGYLVLGLALAYGGWSICVLAQTSWGALLSPDYHERSRIYGWWQLFNLLGLLLILLLPIAANKISPGPAVGVHTMGLCLLVVLPLSTALAVFTVREPAPKDGAPKANLGDWFRLFRSAAVRRLLTVDLLIGLAFGMTGALFLFFFTKAKGFSLAFADVGLLFYFIGGLIYAAPNQISRAMMADAADEERLESGADHTGLLYAILTGTAKIGAALSVGVTFVGLDKLAGFDASSDHNTPGAITGLYVFFLALPAVLFILAGLLLIRYPLTRQRHDEIRGALEQQSQT